MLYDFKFFYRLNIEKTRKFVKFQRNCLDLKKFEKKKFHIENRQI